MLTDDRGEKNDGSRVGVCILCAYQGIEREHICTVANVKNGYEFFVDNRRFLADVPSMTVGEIKGRVGHGDFSGAHYRTFQIVGAGPGDWVELADASALDLRTAPHIAFVPPATY